MKTITKIIIIVTGLVIILFISSAIFVFFSKKEGETITKTVSDSLFPILENILPIKTTTDTIGNITDSVTETITGEKPFESISRIFTGPVADFDFVTGGGEEYITVLDNNQKHLYISKLYENKFQRINNQTQYGQTSVKVLTNTLNGKSVVTRTNHDTQKSDLTYVDFTNLSSTTHKNLNQQTSAIDILDNKIITFVTDKNNTFFYNNGFDFNSYSTIFKTPLTNFDTKSTSKDIFIGSKSSSFKRSQWYRFNFKINNIEKVLEGDGLVINPSPDGQKILYSTNRLGQLFLYDIKDKKIRTISLSTIADKCAWFTDEQTKVVCGVPKTITSGTIWPDDWYKGKVSTSDSLYFVGITTPEIWKFTGDGDIDKLNIDIEKIKISNDGYNILLKNKKDGVLWSVKLQ